MLKAETSLSQTQPLDGSNTVVTEGRHCENCGAPGQDTRLTWCRHCGYYAVLGRCVDLDQEWESAVAPEATEQEQDREKASLGLAVRSIPRWIWPLAGVVVGVTGLTIAVRFATPEGSVLRIRWAFLQLAAGATAFLLAQCWACMKAASQDSQFSPWDAVLRPFAVWGPAVAELPRTLRPLMTSVAGATAIIAVLTVGGFPYDYIFDGEIAKKPPSRNLVKAIASQAQQVQNSGEEDLGESIKDFAETSEGLDAAAQKTIERSEACDCLIIGFLPSESAEVGFTALLVAAPVGEQQQLQFVATVREGLSPELRAELKERLTKLVRPSPFVPCNTPGAVWLDPALTCRVRFAEWTENYFLIDPAFELLLQKVETP